MIFVSDIFNQTQKVLGTSDATTTYDYLNRAVRLLRNKACTSNVTWDPSLIYCNIATQSSNSYVVTLPYQIEKPIAVNLNTNPSFNRGQLFEFTMNGPGSADPLLGFQWMDQGTKPLQIPLPVVGQFPSSQGNRLLFTSDNVGDTAVVFICLVQNLDNSESTIPITLGIPSAPVQDLLAVNKPVTLGNISVSANGLKVAVYAPAVTHPAFNQIKISQLGASVRLLGRRRYIVVSNLTDFIPLESIEAVIQMVKAVKYYDEDQYAAAMQCEQTAITWISEDNSSRMLYAAMAAATQVSPVLNINIYNRDSVIVADVYEAAVAAFGPIGLQNIFDQITIVCETLQNMSQWDPQIGYVDIQSFGGPDGNQYYVTLPRYVEEVLAMSLNGHPARFQNKWFEFNMDGLQQDNFDGRHPSQAGSPLGLWSNRPLYSYEDIGEFVIAFDPLPVNTAFQVVAVASNAIDMGANFRIFGYDANNLPIYDSDGSKGFLVPVTTSSGVFAPNPAGANMVRIERITRDASSGFVNLWSCDSSGNLIQLLGTYWPDETEPKYRRIRLGQRPVLSSLSGVVQYPVMRMRYRKRWTKITSLTDPLHLRSRKAIIEGMKAVTLAANQTSVMAPGQGFTMERNALEVAAKYLNDEWRSLHQREGLDIQVDQDLWPSVTHNEGMV